MKTAIVGWLIFSCAALTFAGNSLYAGTYRAENILLAIKETGTGQYAATLVIGGASVQFTAHEKNGTLTGMIMIDGDTTSFTMMLKGRTLTFVGGEET